MPSTTRCTADFCSDIVEIMQEGLLVVSADGKIQMVNRALEEITGYSREEILERPCTIFRCDACKLLQPDSDGAWCQLFAGQEQMKRKCHLIRKDGSCVTVLKTATVLKDGQDGSLNAVEVVTDVSEMDRMDRELRQLSRTLDEETTFQGMIGHSSKMKEVFELVEKAAPTDFPVLICGESGTGKELVAQALHKMSLRANQPYMQVNCAALNEYLIESELFGHVKGAFTGALQHRKGRFEAADKGSIFLDEIGDLPLSTQVKLLRVLENKTFERVGDNRTISVDVRFIIATNKNLPELVEEERFRQDLYYRINVVRINLPPLRERMEDVPHLVHFFTQRLSQRSRDRFPGVSPETMRIFMHYPWPGNVRELKSTLESGYVLSDGNIIEPQHLPEQLRWWGDRSEKAATSGLEGEERKKVELIEALKKSGGNKSKAARILGINRVTVLNRMRKHGIDPERDLHA